MHENPLTKATLDFILCQYAQASLIKSSSMTSTSQKASDDVEKNDLMAVQTLSLPPLVISLSGGM
jgi:hypothetical protein